MLQVKKGGTNTKDIIGFYFMATSWSGTPINNEPERHSEIGWFAVDALPQNVTEHAKQALNGLLKQIPYSEN